MPKKRNTNWSRSKKEKQIITTRLIEISLIVEDYVYKQKPISVCEAEQYIREVLSYKVQCSRDERSLQVIEKLTRCMKAIVLDHQELRPEIHTINDDSFIAGGVVRAGSISPVYSISEEDRTQLTEMAEEANTDGVIVDLTNIDDDDDSMHNGTNNATTVNAGSRVTVEVDIHRGLSSLSLRDGGKPLDMSTDANCSQSILNNFEGVEPMQQNEIYITPQRAVAGGLVDDVTNSKITTNVMQAVGNNSVDKILNKKTSPIIDSNKTVRTAIALNKPIIFNKNNNLKYNTVVQNKEPLKVNNATNYISSPTFHLASNKIPKNQRQTWYDSNRTCTLNDSSPTLKDANHFNPLIKINKDVNQVTVEKADTLKVNIPTNKFNATEKEKHLINTTETSRALQLNNIPMSDSTVVQENTITTKKKRRPKKKLTDVKVKTPKTKRVTRAPKSNKENTFTNTTKKNIIPIYNENVVDDLSWMENIRYVREIRVDENDPKLNLEESFWDNYYLPANWSDEFV